MVRVTVPATSANMGSGYDSIGIALELYNVIDLAENDHIDISDKNWSVRPAGREQPDLSVCKARLRRVRQAAFRLDHR